MALSENVFVYDTKEINFELIPDYFNSNESGIKGERTDLRVSIRTKDNSYINVLLSDCKDLNICVNGLETLEKFKDMHEKNI